MVCSLQMQVMLSLSQWGLENIPEKATLSVLIDVGALLHVWISVFIYARI